jgi:hypothetical protein
MEGRSNEMRTRAKGILSRILSSIEFEIASVRYIS